MQNKYVKIHSLLRMAAALLAIIVFISMFSSKMVVHETFENVFFDFGNGAFFGDETYKGNVLAFIGYILVLLGGLAGLAFVFIDELIGKDLTKTLSYVAGGVALAGGLLILLFAPMFLLINNFNHCTTAAGPIVFGIFGLCVGAINVLAPILEEKGK